TVGSRPENRDQPRLAMPRWTTRTGANGRNQPLLSGAPDAAVSQRRGITRLRPFGAGDPRSSHDSHYIRGSECIGLLRVRFYEVYGSTSFMTQDSASGGSCVSSLATAAFS